MVIVSDGGYGVLGFDGDTSDHLGLPGWYEPHIKAWAAKATPQTTLWFWNSEVGWASVHPILEKYGFRYINANFWNKGKAHIARNVNTQKIRRFPVVTPHNSPVLNSIHLRVIGIQPIRKPRG
jgi:site-specific DNA-methyltransferase (adenine-specific)